SREVKSRIRIAGPARGRIRERIGANRHTESIITVHAEGPVAGSGNSKNAGSFSDKVVFIDIDGEPRKSRVATEISAAAGVEIIDHVAVFSKDRGLLSGVGQDAVGSAKIADADVGANVFDG